MGIWHNTFLHTFKRLHLGAVSLFGRKLRVLTTWAVDSGVHAPFLCGLLRMADISSVTIRF